MTTSNQIEQIKQFCKDNSIAYVHKKSKTNTSFEFPLSGNFIDTKTLEIPDCIEVTEYLIVYMEDDIKGGDVAYYAEKISEIANYDYIRNTNGESFYAHSAIFVSVNSDNNDDDIFYEEYMPN